MDFAIAKHHSVIFPNFKNKHSNMDAVLIASGPTLEYYNAIKNGIHFGINQTFLNEKIPLDYWFAIDYAVTSHLIDKLKNKNFIKFFGQCSSASMDHYYRYEPHNETYHFPSSVIESVPNSFKFYFDHPSNEINRDIETQALPDLGSCVFSTAYFAIYTGIKRLFLVGCDCAKNGYFNQQQQSHRFSPNILLTGWKIFKQYVDIFHPDVEIISINPIGLKGMFKDVYTEDYLNAHPEIDRNNINILTKNGEIK